MKETRKTFMKEYVRFYLILLLLFFSVSYLVLRLKLFEVDTYTMPDLVGKYYIDIHNELSKYKLNVEIRKLNIKEKPEGIIIQQNIMPGELVKPKDKLVLVVNAYEPFLPMPRVEELSLNNAIEVLSTIPYDGEIYRLEVSKIFYVYNKNLPDNIVLFQFPAPETRIKPGTRVILIVSRNDTSLLQEHSLSELEGMDLAIVAQYLVFTGKPYFIKEVLSTKKRDEDGKVKYISYSGNVAYLSVFYQEKKKTFFSDYEKMKIKFKREESCKIYTSSRHLDEVEDITGERLLWFSSPNVFPEKEMEFIMHRSGDMYLYLLCNDKLIWKKKRIPDYRV